MSKALFDTLRREIVTTESKTGRSWQLRADNHVAVVSIVYDGNSNPNKIAGLPKGHPIKVKKNADAIKQDPTLAVQPDVKNYYSFAINPAIKQARFNDQAQEIIADNLLSDLSADAALSNYRQIVLYPAQGNEYHMDWMTAALQKAIGQNVADVTNDIVQIAEKKKAPGIAITFLNNAVTTEPMTEAERQRPDSNFVY